MNKVSLAILVVFTWAPGTPAAEPIVPLGAGSYRTTLPATCKPLPTNIRKTADLSGPMITNQWWSSLVWLPHSQNLFAHPLAMRCTDAGLLVTYPGTRVRGDKAGIFGSGNLSTGDLILGHSEVDQFPEAVCGGFSDWFVTAVFEHHGRSLRTSFGHGSPFVYCMIEGGEPTVSFGDSPRIWAGSANDALLGVTSNGAHYGLFGPSGSTWSGLNGKKLVCQTGGRPYFAVALLPDDRPETLALFAKHAYAHVTDTRVEYTVENGIVRARYRFICSPREGDETATLFAMYPHQWKYATSPPIDKSYGSVRGTMKIAVGAEFQTAVPVQGLLPLLPSEGIASRDRVADYLQKELDAVRRRASDFADTYWEGKYLGRLATLSGVAEAAEFPEARDALLGEIKRRLENWFTATPGEEQPLFHYDATWGTLIGSRPSFGSDHPLNDHHFHYGYFIRAAAEVARRDPEWAQRWAPMVDLLIRDIASQDRDDAMFPHLRCFDQYAGHGWASGDANFADGNNQESSSESLNAWYGIALWGEATGNASLRDTGLFLFNTERTAVEEYWFDVDGTNYPVDFPNVALGMVWGGKGAFGTWFSADIDCIHGINWLPFTPASLYMGRRPDYVRKNFDRIVADRAAGRDFNTGWGDLVVMFGGLEDPRMAATHIDDHPECKVEGGNSRAFMYHWCHTLDRLGRNDSGVTADYPFHSVFQKGGVKTYAVYNYGPAPRGVQFSDGMTVLAAPGRVSVESSSPTFLPTPEASRTGHN